MPKRPNPRAQEQVRIKGLAAAKLRSEGLTQQQIATRTGFSQPEVSRLLHQAVAVWHFLDPHPRLLRENATALELNAAERICAGAIDYADRLRSAYRGKLPRRFHVHVHDLDLAPGKEQYFFEQAALSLLELLMAAQLVGVMCGRTLFQIVVCLRAFVTQFRKRKQIDFIPVSGDPLHIAHLAEAGYSASLIAAQFQEVLGTKPASELPTLSGVPAYLPPALKDLEAVERFIEGLPGYREIFGQMRRRPATANTKKLDTLLTGIGVLSEDSSPRSHSTGAFIMERILQRAVSDKELRRLVYGDIAGILIPRSELGTKDLGLVDALNRGWTGLDLEELRALAKNARDGGAPGIVVIARELDKADVLHEVIRRGLVNECILARPLADKIIASLPAPSPTR